MEHCGKKPAEDYHSNDASWRHYRNMLKGHHYGNVTVNSHDVQVSQRRESQVSGEDLSEF